MCNTRINASKLLHLHVGQQHPPLGADHANTNSIGIFENTLRAEHARRVERASPTGRVEPYARGRVVGSAASSFVLTLTASSVGVLSFLFLALTDVCCNERTWYCNMCMNPQASAPPGSMVSRGCSRLGTYETHFHTRNFYSNIFTSTAPDYHIHL